MVDEQEFNIMEADDENRMEEELIQYSCVMCPWKGDEDEVGEDEDNGVPICPRCEGDLMEVIND